MEDKYPWIIAILQSISSTQNASILVPYGISLVTSSITGRVNDTGMEEDLDAPSHQPGSTMYTSEVLDASSGMQELEDAAAASENQWRNSDNYGQDAFFHSVQIVGMTMNKSCAIAQQFRYVTSASSTD